MDAPRDFTRSVPFEVERADNSKDGLTLSGHAAVFDQVTRIDSWEGQFDEVIQRGAFRKTLRERTPVLMFEHGKHPLIGSMPLGTITKAREDDTGLWIEARLHDNWLIEPVRDAITSKSVDGMSFRFEAVKDAWQNDKRKVPLRTLQELRVPELGPVVFPAYSGTDVAVRSLFDQLPDEFLAELKAQLLGTRTNEAASGTSLAEPPPTEPLAPGTPRSLPASVIRHRLSELGVKLP